MTVQRLTQVLLARERLLARIADQRSALARYGAGLAPPLRLVDRAVEAARFVRQHPATTAAAAGALLVLRGRTLLGLAVRAFGIWRLVQRTRVFLRHAGY